MRNLKLVLLFELVVCFLQGCDPAKHCSFYIRPMETYKPVQSNEAFHNDLETSAYIIDSVVLTADFQKYEFPEECEKSYQKHSEAGVQIISLMLRTNKDMIQVSVIEMPSFELSENSRNLFAELVRLFQSEFGNDRIKVAEGCLGSASMITDRQGSYIKQ